MDPIKKIKLRLYYICGESLVFLSLASTLVLNLALSNLLTTSVTRGQNLKLFKSHVQRSNFFSIRSINAWNTGSLPNEVVSTNSVNSFKILFDNYYSYFLFAHEQDSQAYAFFSL